MFQATLAIIHGLHPVFITLSPIQAGCHYIAVLVCSGGYDSTIVCIPGGREVL